MYNHFSYTEALARNLKAISHTDDDCHFFRATEQMDLGEIEENISSMHGMIMLSIDGKESTFSFTVILLLII